MGPNNNLKKLCEGVAIHSMHTREDSSSIDLVGRKHG